ncbi:alpha/beta fold hydrolase [Herbihabitans rhizosphaerae]|uniref:alpha/beta fold hydrolase n=1 Tax=Herbihabitans rhizosphaerae TaxID=1872711 RepID=UPI001F5E374C|nr:alpha/beta hydrolase [Herbihabitans rhizosphaerae]
MTTTVSSVSRLGGDGTDNRTVVRAPLTHVPLSTTALPPLDTSIPAWPGEQMQAGGVRLHVRHTAGPDGTTALFVHGLGGSSTNWTDLAGQLSGQADGLSVDLPGSGRSVPDKSHPYTPEASAALLADFVRGLDRGPVHLLGNSMGGAIAILLAARVPDLVRTLTLISPAVPDLRPNIRRVSDPRLPLAFMPVVGARFRRAMAQLTPRERVMQVLELCYADASTVSEARIAEAVEHFTELQNHKWAGPALASSTVGLIRSWLVPRSRSLWTVARTINAPTLVVWGTDDRLVTVRKADRTASTFPRGRMLVLPRTGHVAQMERPVTVARAVLGMWEAVERGEW